MLYKDRERYDFYIHHLVAAAFITGYYPGVHVRHEDDDKTNNHAYNLRFPMNKRLGQFVRDPERPSVRRVVIVENGLVFRTVEDCAKHLEGDPSSIYRVLRGDRRSHKGFTFAYLEDKDVR